MSIAEMRQEFERAHLLEDEAVACPLDQFTDWFEQARHAAPADANTMTLATVDADCQPTARIVLLKAFDELGFVWFTNYDSRKGRNLQAVPRASLLFYWPALERQVSIEGMVRQVPAAESDVYFASRPRASQIGALASDQSRPIGDRAALDARFAAATTLAGDATIARPPHWGGYRLEPQRFEFWQGRSSRLHDRLVYLRHSDGSWQRERLQP